MANPTLAVAILAAVLVLVLRPARAMVAHIAALIWYPSYARVSIGTIDFSVGRIVVAVLLLRCLCSDRIRGNFRWFRLDTWVLLSMTVYVGIFLLTRPLERAVENRAGFLMDTFLFYLAARFIIKDKTTLMAFIKGISVAVAALAMLGVIESVTHWQPFVSLKSFRPWDMRTAELDPVSSGPRRWGFTRANVSFSHSILFGDCIVMFLPLIWFLRHQRDNWGKMAYPLSGAAILGAFSSLSSGAWVMLIATIFCLVMERYKRWVKPLLVAGASSCIIIEAISNRPFYHVLYSYMNPVGGVWFQRAKLVDSAIEDFGEWWLLGYGGRDPGWGQRFGTFTDANNEFILMGILYGLLGIVVLCAVLVVAFRGLVFASRQTRSVELKSLYWALGSVLAGVIVAWQGVSFFGQLPSLFYSILGIAGSSIAFVRFPEINRPRFSQASERAVALAPR